MKQHRAVLLAILAVLAGLSISAIGTVSGATYTNWASLVADYDGFRYNHSAVGDNFVLGDTFQSATDYESEGISLVHFGSDPDHPARFSSTIGDGLSDGDSVKIDVTIRKIVLGDVLGEDYFINSIRLVGKDNGFLDRMMSAGGAAIAIMMLATILIIGILIFRFAGRGGGAKGSNEKEVVQGTSIGKHEKRSRKASNADADVGNITSEPDSAPAGTRSNPGKKPKTRAPRKQ